MFRDQRLLHLMEKVYKVIEDYDSDEAPLLCQEVFTVLAVPFMEAALNVFVTREEFMERVGSMWDTAQGTLLKDYGGNGESGNGELN